ncbi:hypothetical protein H0H87_001669 [Tephrocybe sp. NHM501043]|nr:hypothetical protein H0H87_001669 [Tephrocybe sp. NHM501043]
MSTLFQLDLNRSTLTVHASTNKDAQGQVVSTVLQQIPAELVSLNVNVGPGLLDQQPLLSVLQEIKNRCTNIVLFSITMDSISWSDDAAALVLDWAPSILRTIRVVDPVLKCEASKTVRQHSLKVKQGLSATIPLDLFNHTTIASNLSVFDRLAIDPPLDPSRATDVNGLLNFLLHARELQKLSLPFDLDKLRDVLYRVSALPGCNALTFVACGQVDLFHVIPAFISGLEGFHHLVKLCLPSDALLPSVHICLRALQGLRQVKIIVNPSTFPDNLEEPRYNDYAALETLKVVGSFSDLGKALRAFANPETRLKRVDVKCRSTEDIVETFKILKVRCPGLRRLSIIVDAQDFEDCEQLHWAELEPLTGLRNIRVFILQHPRALFLSNVNIQCLRHAWSRADLAHISFNGTSLSAALQA